MFSPKNISDLLKISLNAGKEILSVYNTSNLHSIQYKEDNSPLTDADLRSHEVICAGLESVEISGFIMPVLSEESEILPDERKDWNCFWLVDPLDGTKEFIRRNGEFTVNIALIKEGKPVFGLIYQPVDDSCYYGIENSGSFRIQNLSNIDIDGYEAYRERLTLDQFNPCKEPFTIVASRSHLNEDTRKFIEKVGDKYGRTELISAGSSLKFCLMAEGKASVYPRMAPTMEWDTAAGHAICASVGLSVIDMSTMKEMEYNKPVLRNSYFVVTYRSLLKELFN